MSTQTVRTIDRMKVMMPGAFRTMMVFPIPTRARRGSANRCMINTIRPAL
jgi:hypothetical protein